MVEGIELLQVRLSGGAANVNPDLSLGGQMSTVVGGLVRSQDTTGLSNVTGVEIKDAFGNSQGIGSLRWVSSSGNLGWEQPGQSGYEELAIVESGSYLLGSFSKGFLLVNVALGSLPAGNANDSISVSNRENAVWDDIQAGEGVVGDVEYRCLFLYNAASTTWMYGVRVWLEADASGADSLAVAVSSALKNQAALGPLADEEDSTNILSSLVFLSPLTQESGVLIGDLGPGEFRSWWIRRSVPSGTLISNPYDLSKIGISALI